jgi:hypothetical protein
MTNLKTSKGERSALTTRGGNKAKNQFIEWHSDCTLFVSYETIIVKTTFDGNGNRIVYLDKHYFNYSRTTVRYRNEFLGVTTKQLEARILDGTYLLTDLN